MFSKELSDWFHTRRWLVQTIVWLAAINGFIAFVVWVVPTMGVAEGSEGQGQENAGALALSIYMKFLVLLGTIGVIILAQDEVIGEKQSGTVAWVLSKPVSRSSFILSKLAADAIGVIAFIVALPAVVAYAEVSLAAGKAIDAGAFLAGVGVATLTLLFYLTLVLLLGVLFDQRGPVLGISLGLLFGVMLLVSFLPWIAYFLPANMDVLSLTLAMGQPLPSTAVYTCLATAGWAVIFTVVALWRFERREL